MKHIIATFTLFAGIVTAQAQTGNIGIGNTTPGSKLTVNGSFAAAYNNITGNAYSAGENDFYVNWHGTAAGTITLPASTTGTDRTGRLYFFRNTSTIYTLTIDAAGTELIDNVQTVVLKPGESGVLMKTNVNTATGTTYELVIVSQTDGSYSYAVSSATAETHNQGAIVTANFTQTDFSTNSGGDFNLATDTWTCPKAGVYRIEFTETGHLTTLNASAHRLLVINKNGTGVSNQYYEMVNTAAPVKYTGGYMTAVLNLQQGDAITVSLIMCNLCGPTSMSSDARQMIISRL